MEIRFFIMRYYDWVTYNASAVLAISYW